METIGPYQVIRELGRGGMGAVYEVRHPEHSRHLALKLILPGVADADSLLRFQREAQVMARVRHRGVVVIHQLERAPQGPYIVSELVEGETLEKRLERGPVEPRSAAEIVRELADALAAVHAAGAVHRDLKPANVMIRPDGSPAILDFGLVRDQRAETLTKTGTMLGTPHYMSPEQLNGDRVGPSSDLYGLGAVLYALLTGRRPFADVVGALPLINAVLSRAPARPSALSPGVPSELEAICVQAMAQNAAERYPDAAALRDDVDRYLSGARVAAPLVSAARSRGPALAAAALLIAVAGVGWLGSDTAGDRPKRAALPEPTPNPTVTPIDSAVLLAWGRLRGGEFDARHRELVATFGGERPELNRVHEAREALRALLNDVRPKTAAEWRDRFAGVHVPRGLRREYLATAVRHQELRTLGENNSRSTRLIMTDDSLIAFAPAGRRALALWSLEAEQTLLKSLPGPPYPSLRPPAFDRHGRLFVLGRRRTREGYVALRTTLELATPERFLIGSDAPDVLRPVIAASAGGERLAVGYGKRIDVFDGDFVFLQTLPERHLGEITSMAFLRDGTLISAGGQSTEILGDTFGQLCAWDLADPASARVERFEGETHVLAVGLEGFAVAVHFTWTVFLYRCTANGLERVRAFVGSDIQTRMNAGTAALASPPVSAVFSPDGRRLYVGGGDPQKLHTGELRVFDTENGTQLAVRVGHRTTNLVALGLTRDGTRLVSSGQTDDGSDGTGTAALEVWDVDLPPSR